MKENVWKTYTDEQEKELEALSGRYKAFLNAGKTERECAAEAIRLARAAGYQSLEEVQQTGKKLEAGDKVYACGMKKMLVLFQIGRKPLEDGMRILGAHIDSPRLDLKQNPLYEADELAFLKTHYYGGLRKYQWVTIPLELHGVVALKSGQVVRISVGNGEGDPLFTIDDLLPHLGVEQSKKPLGEAIPGESLNILVGSRPLADDEGKDRIKLSVLELLNRKYGITEEDFISAELSAVPAFSASDIGFDRSLIGAYGHDDRVCAYAALAALLQLGTPERTAVCMLADKEEIGSQGVTGMKSAAFDTFVSDLCDASGALKACYEQVLLPVHRRDRRLRPNFAEVYEKRNSARVNYGVGLCKYTGARGKSGASDADAETVAYIRNLFDEAGVIWQIAELGKVDAGGGGTVAMYMANRNITTLDAGVPVLSMHAPFETVSKLDCYETYKGMKAVFQAEK